MYKIAVLNYGVGNLRSLMNALESIGAEAYLIDTPKSIDLYDKLIIPGVGAFPYCIDQLKKSGFVPVIENFVENSKSILGICVGMQMLFEHSDEHGGAKGLGLIKGKVIQLPIKLSDDVRLPHIGWNKTLPHQNKFSSDLFSEPLTEQEYYFVHSFICCPEEPSVVLTSTVYGGVEFISAVLQGNICGMQFHPERSGPAGLKLLREFVDGYK